jgi:flagellar basal body-associated protein FliL
LKAQHVSSGIPLIIRSSKLYLQPLVYIIIIIIYVLTAIGLSPGGSTHLHTNNTHNNTNNNLTTQITIYNPNNNMWKIADRAPSLRVFTLAFALQLRKKHGKTTVVTTRVYKPEAANTVWSS